MKLIRAALLTCTSLLAMTVAARADFIFTPIAFALFAGPLGAVASFGAIYTGLQIAAYAAVLGAQLALAAGRDQPKIDPGEMKNTFQESETSEMNAIGRVRLGGLKAFGNTKDNFISRLVWHSKGPMVAVEQYHVGGREVTVEDTGAVSSPPWATSGGSWMTIQTKVGDGTETAWPQLMTDFPTLWTSAHRARGIFQSLVRFKVPALDTPEGNKKFQKLYQGGAPDITVTARVNRVYDPRDSGQDINDFESWDWSENGPLCTARILLDYPDLDVNDFDWDFIADEADKADVLVATLSGTEPRSRCWGVWPSENERGTTMQQVLDSVGCDIILSETGLIRIRLLEDDPEPEISFTSLHMTELNWKSGPEAVERPNLCRIKYYSPERGYDLGEIDMTGIAWARADDEIARYGEKIFDVELPFCPSASQAQRLARALFLKARADSGAINTNMAGVAAWDVTYATIADDDSGEEMLCRLAPPRIDDTAGKVDIPYIVWPQELITQPWNPATMEAEPPIEAPELQYESELDTPDAPSAGILVQYEDNSYEFRIAFTGVDDGNTAEAVFRTYTGGQPDLYAGMTEYEATGDDWYAWEPGAGLLGKEIDAKVRFFTSDDEGSYFSDVLNIPSLSLDNTSPSAPDLDVSYSSAGGGLYNIDATATLVGINAVKFVLERLLLFTWVEVAQSEGRPGDVLTADLSGVGGGTTYKYRAIAYSSNGSSAMSPEVEVTPP